MTELDDGYRTAAVPAQRMPLQAMVLLSLAAFVTLLTEIMPAGLLSALSRGLGVTQAVGGQFITAFAWEPFAQRYRLRHLPTVWLARDCSLLVS